MVLYAVNVFATFTLSQLGMVLHWWKVRSSEPRWAGQLTMDGVGLFLTGLILVFTLALKFLEGAWVTVLITGSAIALCFAIRRHYEQVRAALRKLDDTLINVAFPPDVCAPAAADRASPTAVLMVSGFNGVDSHSLLSIQRTFPGYFRNVVFVQVGVVDSSRFKGRREIRHLEKAVLDDLEEYKGFARNMGVYAEARHAMRSTPSRRSTSSAWRRRPTFRAPRSSPARWFSGARAFSPGSSTTRRLRRWRRPYSSAAFTPLCCRS